MKHFINQGLTEFITQLCPNFGTGQKYWEGGGGMAPLDPILPPFLFHLAFSEEWSTTGQNLLGFFLFFLKTYILHHQQHRNFRKSWSWYFGAYLTLSSKLLTHCMTNSRVRGSYIAADIYLHIFAPFFEKT